MAEWRKALEDRGMRVSRQKTEHLYTVEERIAEPARIKMQEERYQEYRCLNTWDQWCRKMEVQKER